MATGSLRGPRFTPCRPALSVSGPSLKPRVACCLRPCQRIWRAGSPTRPSTGSPCPHPGGLRLEALRTGAGLPPHLGVYVGSHRRPSAASVLRPGLSSSAPGWPRLRLAPPPAGLASGWPHLRLAPPPAGLASGWPHLRLASPPAGLASGWPRLRLAPPPAGPTPGWPHLRLAPPPAPPLPVGVGSPGGQSCLALSVLWQPVVRRTVGLPRSPLT
ncbi:MAG: hypothetical protein ACI8RZ_002869 [Myxococcota bacterium]|jgi:hypothetical protein